MEDKRLLCSYDTFEYETITEAADPATPEAEKPLLLKGIMQKADTLNQNGRVYSKAILEREVRNYQKFIAERRAFGELDHPDESVINLKNVSHIVRECYLDGNVVYGTIEILKTPMGLIAEALVKAKTKLGISSRGVGSTVVRDGHHEVQSDFCIICFDLVSEPSTTSAFMLPEGRRISLAGLSHVLTKSDRVDRALNDILYTVR